MQRSRVRNGFDMGFLVAVAIFFAVPLAAQCRHFLYFGTTPVFADNVPTCYSRVVAAMNGAGFGGVKQNSGEVVGTKGGVYASVTCIATAPRSTAVVMVVGGDDAETRTSRDQLRDKVANTQGF
jgi:hypothetical protein